MARILIKRLFSIVFRGVHGPFNLPYETLPKDQKSPKFRVLGQ